MCPVCPPAIGQRAGPRPRTTPTNPHTQLEQNAPRHLQERLFARACELPDVIPGRSVISFPDSRAFLLRADRRGPPDAFMAPDEFAHLHPATDGSLHMCLPEDTLEHVYRGDWGEPHPVAGRYGLPRTIAMIYGPRDEAELNLVWSLLRRSHAFANGT